MRARSAARRLAFFHKLLLYGALAAAVLLVGGVHPVTQACLTAAVYGSVALYIIKVWLRRGRVSIPAAALIFRGIAPLQQRG